jgi:hypothetical protein
VVVVAVLAEVLLGRLAGAPDFALFVGRFHPLVVHLPIGFFLLVRCARSSDARHRERVRRAADLGVRRHGAVVKTLGA